MPRTRQHEVSSAPPEGDLGLTAAASSPPAPLGSGALPQKLHDCVCSLLGMKGQAYRKADY